MEIDHTDDPDGFYESGFVLGLLISRYAALRTTGLSDPTFDAPAPSDIPEVVRELLKLMPRAAVNARLFESRWNSLDRLLLSDTPEELRIALQTASDARIQ